MRVAILMFLSLETTTHAMLSITLYPISGLLSNSERKRTPFIASTPTGSTHLAVME